MRFVAAATAYMRAVEGDADAADLLRTLAELYAAALALREVDVDLPDDDPPGEDLTHEEWKVTFDRLAIRQTGADPDLHLADHLADVWRDVKNGLRRWEKGPSRFDASIILEGCRAGFEVHWGSHATEALRTLHEEAFRGGGKC